MTIKQGGQYILINGNRTDHALEVSDDHKSVTCAHFHGGRNQQWEIRNSDGDEHWFVRSRVGRWLGVEGSLANSTRIEPLEREFEWTILRESHIFRLVVPGTELNVDIVDHEDLTDKIPVHLWEKTADKKQTWILKEVEVPMEPVSVEHHAAAHHA